MYSELVSGKRSKDGQKKVFKVCLNNAVHNMVIGTVRHKIQLNNNEKVIYIEQTN